VSLLLPITACVTYLETALENIPQLLRHDVAGILDLQRASLRNDILCGKWPLGVSPSRVLPPALDGIDIVGVALVFLLQGSHIRRHGSFKGIRGRHSQVLAPFLPRNRSIKSFTGFIESKGESKREKAREISKKSKERHTTKASHNYLYVRFGTVMTITYILGPKARCSQASQNRTVTSLRYAPALPGQLGRRWLVMLIGQRAPHSILHVNINASGRDHQHPFKRWIVFGASSFEGMSAGKSL
jgi:hypothetical protein